MKGKQRKRKPIKWVLFLFVCNFLNFHIHIKCLSRHISFHLLLSTLFTAAVQHTSFTSLCLTQKSQLQTFDSCKFCFALYSPWMLHILEVYLMILEVFLSLYSICRLMRRLTKLTGYIYNTLVLDYIVWWELSICYIEAIQIRCWVFSGVGFFHLDRKNITLRLAWDSYKQIQFIDSGKIVLSSNKSWKWKTCWYVIRNCTSWIL